MEEILRQSFTAPMGKATVELTVVALVVLLLVAGLQLVLGLRRQGTPRLVLVGAGSLLMVCLVCSMLLKIRGYEVTPSHVLVKYGFSGTRIPIADIRDVTSQPNALRGSNRAAANGGLWSFLGRFSSPELGPVRAYVSDLRRTVVIHLPDYKVVVSPDDAAGFVAAVKKQKGPFQ